MIGAPVWRLAVDLLHVLGDAGRVGGALQECRPDVGALHPSLEV
jgi:hypothetical protein